MYVGVNLLQIEVRLFCGLESCVPGTKFGQPIQLELPEGTNGLALLEKLNIPRDRAFSLMVNGVHKDFDAFFKAGDRVSIFPPVGGG